MNKLWLFFKKSWAWVCAFVLDEEPIMELNVDEIKSGLQAMREAATKSLALAKQAQNEALALQKQRDTLHDQALALQKNGSEEEALAKLEEEDIVQLKLDATLARFTQLQEDAGDNWQSYMLKADEVNQRIEQAKHLQEQTEINRLREESRQVLDGTALDSAMAEFDQKAEEIELETIQINSRIAVEKALSSEDPLLAEGDRLLAVARMHDRLVALKQEALGEGQSVAAEQSEAEKALRAPVLAKVEKTL